MRDLSRKIARMEVLVSARAEEPTAPPYWTPERVQRRIDWTIRLLETMTFERGQRVYAELTTVPADQWGPIARRVHHVAMMGAGGYLEPKGWPYTRPQAFPEAVCEALEAHPDVTYTIDYSCEQCGFQSPHLPYAGPALLAVCPLCEGSIKGSGYTSAIYRAQWERIKQEQGVS